MKTAKEILDKIKVEKIEKELDKEEKKKKKVDDTIAHFCDLFEKMYEEYISVIQTDLEVKVDSIVN